MARSVDAMTSADDTEASEPQGSARTVTARALNSWPQSIIDKIETLSARQDALRAETQLAQTREALTRSRLGEALIVALVARAKAEAEARSVAGRAYRATGLARATPDRRNRLRRLVERLQDRRGPKGQATILAASGLWAGAGGASDLADMEAYAARGADPAAQPPAFFDQAWYLDRYPDVAASGQSPLVHYLLRGGLEGRVPHPLFDHGPYLGQHAPEMGALGLTALEHFIRLGGPRGAAIHPLFQLDHYLIQAPELFETGEIPFLHYLREGAARGLNPHPLFLTDYYCAQAGLEPGDEPLLHYLTQGSAAGLRPHPLFDPAWYRDAYPDVPAAGLDPLVHFVLDRGEGGFSPGPWLDARTYFARRGSDRLPGLDALSDYLQGGAWTVGEPSPGFQAAAYLAAHPELATEGLTPLERWARLGVAS